MTPEKMQEIIAKAKADLAARVAAKAQAGAKTPIASVSEKLATVVVPTAATASPDKPLSELSSWSWNKEQSQAIENGVVGKSFVLIGAAGTGKTTTLRGLLKAKLEKHSIPMLKTGTQNLAVDSPGVVLLSYTRRAVRNIARQMPAELKSHCLTIHRVLEFAPEVYYEPNDMGIEVKKMRFAPQRHEANPLPEDLKCVVIDESSMVSIDLMEMFLAALPNRHAVQFIFLGDLNQLPPVYGQAVLGRELLRLPIVELTQVYRQALESPIIALALAVKNNNFAQFNRDAVDLWCGDKFKDEHGKPKYMAFNAKEIREKIVFEKPGRGKVTLHPWKNRTETEVGLAFMQGQVKAWIDQGVYDPLEDLILCPWNESFGTVELNKAVADKLAKKNDQVVHEVIAGFQKYYFAIGDKLLVDKQEAIIYEIQTNPKYLGKRPLAPSKTLDRWGNDSSKSLGLADYSDMDIDELLSDLQDVEDRVAQASHIVKVRFMDSGEEDFLDKASQFNTTTFGYALTVHKAQGSECRKVFFLTHYCHSAMLFRELVYTAITRAAEELYIVMSPMMLEKAARSPRIKGDTLAAKLEFYQQRLKERL